MVDKIEVTVTDLHTKHNGRAGYENMYSLVKHVYKDDGEVDTSVLLSIKRILKS